MEKTTDTNVRRMMPWMNLLLKSAGRVRSICSAPSLFLVSWLCLESKSSKIRNKRKENKKRFLHGSRDERREMNVRTASNRHFVIETSFSSNLFRTVLLEL